MKTGSELIAIFLDWKPCQCDTPQKLHYKFGEKNWEVVEYDRMKFDTDWNWLMPAVKKWNDLVILKRQEKDGWTKWQYKTIMLRTEIEPLFNDLVKSIEWYNSLPGEVN